VSYRTNATIASSIPLSSNRCYLIPFRPQQTFTSASFLTVCETSVAAAIYQVVIYDSDPTTGQPRTCVHQGSNISASGTGLKTYTYSYTFNAGTQYWFGIITNTNGTQPTLTSIPVTALLPLNFSGTVSSLGGTPNVYCAYTPASNLTVINNPTVSYFNSTFPDIRIII